MAHVFISYKRSSAEKRFVGQMKKHFAEGGIDVWIDRDQLRAGDDWREGIDQAIREALAVVVVLTPGATQSQYVTYEWAFALGVGKKVIPVLYQAADLHPRLVGFHYLDFTDAHPWEVLVRRVIHQRRIR